MTDIAYFEVIWELLEVAKFPELLFHELG